MHNKEIKDCDHCEHGKISAFEYPCNVCITTRNHDYFLPKFERSHKSSSDILVIRAPYMMKKEAMNRAYDQILKQMESGLVMLPSGFSVALCPKDVEVKFMVGEESAKM